jgi:hypothetical protein
VRHDRRDEVVERHAHVHGFAHRKLFGAGIEQVGDLEQQLGALLVVPTSPRSFLERVEGGMYSSVGVPRRTLCDLRCFGLGRWIEVRHGFAAF